MILVKRFAGKDNIFAHAPVIAEIDSRCWANGDESASEFFSADDLESEIVKNQIDCRQPLMTGLALLGALSFGASVPMLLQGGYGYGNNL